MSSRNSHVPFKTKIGRIDVLNPKPKTVDNRRIRVHNGKGWTKPLPVQVLYLDKKKDLWKRIPF